MREFPTLTGVYALVCIDAAMVPIVAGKISELEARSQWASEADYTQGALWAIELERDIMSGCVSDISDRLDRIIMLLGGADALSEPASPPSPMGQTSNLIGTVQDIQGTYPDTWFGFVPGRRVQLKDLLDALSGGSVDDAGTEGATVWDAVLDAIEGVGDVTSVLDDVTGILGNTGGLLSKGSALGVSTALGVANTFFLTTIALHMKEVCEAITARRLMMTGAIYNLAELQDVLPGTRYYDASLLHRQEDIIEVLEEIRELNR
jgi:hypothetical protein